MNITCILPQPSPVVLGDRTYLVPQLRLRDIAALQQWLTLAVPSPYEEHRERIDSLGGRERLVAAAHAYLECEKFPIKVTSRLATYVLATTEGIQAILDLLLPGEAIDPAEVTEDQFHHLWDVIWGGGDSLQDLAAILDGPGPEAPPNEINWGKQATRVIAETGWDFEQVGRMFVSQWLTFLSGGEGEATEMRVHPGEDSEAKRRERIEIFAEAEALMRQRGSGG